MHGEGIDRRIENADQQFGSGLYEFAESAEGGKNLNRRETFGSDDERQAAFRSAEGDGDVRPDVARAGERCGEGDAAGGGDVAQGIDAQAEIETEHAADIRGGGGVDANRIGSGSAAGGGDGDIAGQLEAGARGESGELIDLLQQEVDFVAGKPAENECAGIAEERFDAVHAHTGGERAQDELEHAGEEQARPSVVEGGGERCRRRRRENGEARQPRRRLEGDGAGGGTPTHGDDAGVDGGVDFGREQRNGRAEVEFEGAAGLCRDGEAIRSGRRIARDGQRERRVRRLPRPWSLGRTGDAEPAGG